MIARLQQIDANGNVGREPACQIKHEFDFNILRRSEHVGRVRTRFLDPLHVAANEGQGDGWQAPSSQLKLKDVYHGRLMDDSAGKLVATEEGVNRVSWEFSESESCSIHEDEVTGKLVAHKKGAGKLVSSSFSENSGNPKAEGKKWPHNIYISSAVVSHMDSLIECEKDLRSWADGRNGRPQRERGYLGECL